MNPTVIDALVVTLGLDPSKWTEGQKAAVASMKKTEDQATRTAKELEARGKQAAQFFSSVKNQVLALTAAFLGASGVKQFVAQIVTSDAALGRLSKNLDISAKDLAAWEGVADKFGSSAGDIDAAFRTVMKIKEELRLTGTTSGLQGNAPLAHVLGNGLTEFLNQSTTAERRMRLIQSGLSRLSQQDAQYWGQASGFSEMTVNALRDTNTQMDELLKKQRERNLRTQADADAAIRLDQKWKEVLDTFEQIGRKILREFAPAIEKFLQKLQTYAETVVAVLIAVGVQVLIFTAGPAIAGLASFATGVGAVAGGVTALGVALGVIAGLGSSWLINKIFNNTDSGSLGSWLFDKMNGGSGAGNSTQGPAQRFGTYRGSSKAMSTGVPASSMTLLSLMQRLEGSGPNAVSPKGAIGRNQIMPGTAEQYGFDPQRLFDPAYNDTVAMAILKDLTKKYGGNVDHIAAAYNAGEGGSAKFRASGNLADLPKETQKYIQHERSILGGGSSSHVNIQTMTVVTQATNADGIAQDLGAALRREALAQQAQAGVQ